MGQTDDRDNWVEDASYVFQSPYGVRGRSDKFEKTEVIGNIHDKFQSPYGVRGRSDNIDVATGAYKNAVEFQSPYGVRGRSDLNMLSI